MKKCKSPISHERQKDLVYCMWCKAKIGLSFQEKLDKKVGEVSLEIKQQILDLLHQGKTVGEVCKAVNLELLVVGEIIVRNIGEVHYLRKKAIV